MTPLVSLSNKKLQAVTDRRTAKATDENLTSENWEYILVLNEAVRCDQMLRSIRMFVIESVQKIRGLSKHSQRSIDVEAHSAIL